MNTEYEVLGQRLKTRQDELRQRVASIARDVARRAAADWSEQAQERENDEVLDALGNEAMTELRLIQKALERMEVGDYGVCNRVRWQHSNGASRNHALYQPLREMRGKSGVRRSGHQTVAVLLRTSWL